MQFSKNSCQDSNANNGYLTLLFDQKIMNIFKNVMLSNLVYFTRFELIEHLMIFYKEIIHSR